MANIRINRSHLMGHRVRRPLRADSVEKGRQ
jgi:hypothetical protein